MASPRTGSDALVSIDAGPVFLTIKGSAFHPRLEGSSFAEEQSSLLVRCSEQCRIKLADGEFSGAGTLHTVHTAPMFFEQQNYEIVIEGEKGADVSFSHASPAVEEKVRPLREGSNLLTGVINFRNEIGMSDLVVNVGGREYLRVQIEVFPTKISYREDYLAIMKDVTDEVYNVAFDFLKKTYQKSRPNDRVKSSPVEFFSIISQIFEDFIRATNLIIARPHHELSRVYEVLPAHKVRQVDRRGRKWMLRHADRIRKDGRHITVSKAMSVRKQVSYDTKENRLTKFILLRTVRRLNEFRKLYTGLDRKTNEAVLAEVDRMTSQVNRRINSSFLREINVEETSSGLSLVFSMAAGYRDLYKYFLMLQRGLTLNGDVFKMSVKDLAVLYEYWCFIKLNSLMRRRYELASQDVVKVKGQGLSVTLAKGKKSEVRYKNPVTGDSIRLSYNPKYGTTTGTQKPDNVLSLVKTGLNRRFSHEFVFDAKYKFNPALDGSDYKRDFKSPGPEVEDINTMHRYRDAIVFENNEAAFVMNIHERKMFGAYVLFPYHDEKKYRSHPFFKSIESVNIGGLPFLPSATRLVTSFLDSLIFESENAAFKRTVLPIDVKYKLDWVDWTKQDVLVAGIDLAESGRIWDSSSYEYFHVPVHLIKDSYHSIRYVALYKSIAQFGAKDAGIYRYGEVLKVTKVPRRFITEIPGTKNRDEEYYRFKIKEWLYLKKPIKAKEEFSKPTFLTNLFLLENASEVPELKIQSQEEYRVYQNLRRIIKDGRLDTSKNLGFKVNDVIVSIDKNRIEVSKDKDVKHIWDVSHFEKHPGQIIRKIRELIGVAE